MKSFWFPTAVLAALLALSAPAVQAGGGGQSDWDGKLAGNGPALDGRQVQAPDGLSIDSASGTQVGYCPPGGCGTDRPALAAGRVAAPGLFGSVPQ